MLKIIGKACISVIVAFLLSLTVWYFLLIKLPEHQVQGVAAPTMTKEKGHSPMQYHDIKIAYIKDGQWVFDRGGKIIPLVRK